MALGNTRSSCLRIRKLEKVEAVKCVIYRCELLLENLSKKPFSDLKWFRLDYFLNFW